MRPRWRGDCRDQIIEWLEGCTAVEGSFNISQEHGKALLNMVRQVPPARPDFQDKYRAWIGKHIKVYDRHGSGAGWWTTTLRAVSETHLIGDGFVIAHKDYAYFEVMK